MLQDRAKVKKVIKNFSILTNEYVELGKQLHHIKERLDEIELEMSEMRNYLYRDRPKDFIYNVAGIVDEMIKGDKKNNYKDALNELKEIIDLWLKDYAHYSRFGTDLSPFQRKRTKREQQV